MALVAYGSSSSDSDSDQLEDFIPTVKTLKESKKVKISIPSLADFDDLNTDEPSQKHIKVSQKGSGLLNILPPVKSSPISNVSFVPKSVANRKNVQKLTRPTKKSKTLPVITPKAPKPSGSESEDEELAVPDTFDDDMWNKVCGRPQKKVVVQSEPVPPIIVDIAPEPEKPYDGLDNTAFKELVGKSKMPVGNIKLIDINEEEILPDKDLWMTKSLTDPEMAPKAEVEDPVDPTRRKKHHITYLAQQAKANEQDLKNAWASSKNNRMMSRSKYGF